MVRLPWLIFFFGYAGPIFPVKPDGAEVLGEKTFTDISQIPAGEADLVLFGLLEKLLEKGSARAEGREVVLELSLGDSH